MLDLGWTIEQTTGRFQVDAKTVRKWRDRFLAEGIEESFESPAPFTEPYATCMSRRVLMARRKGSWGWRSALRVPSTGSRGIPPRGGSGPNLVQGRARPDPACDMASRDEDLLDQAMTAFDERGPSL